MQRATIPFASIARTVLTVIVLAAATILTAGAALLSGPAGALTGSAIRTDSTAAPGLETWGDNDAGQLGDASLKQGLVPVSAITSAAGDNTITSVSAGGRHDLALLSNGTVLAWGDDTFGQLGNGGASANDNAETPTVVEGLSGVVAVSAGDEDSLALLSNGTVMSFGDNDNGQLGDGTKTASDVPVLVKGLSGVTAISAGLQFNLAVLSNGTVESWGNNNDGQLGDNSTKNSEVPVAVKGLTGVTDVSAGGFTSFALLGDGTVMSWGDNTSDELGDGQTQSASLVPVAVDGLTDAVAISAGQQHALALTNSGTVEAWGDNGFFQLGRPTANDGGVDESDVPLAVPGIGHATSIAAGDLYSLALSKKGTVFAWGDNAFGQLGNDSDATNSPVVKVKDLSGVTAIAASGAQSVAIVGASATGPSSQVAASQKSSPWQVVASPMPAAGVGLRALSASSPTDAWAVGSTENGQPTAEPAGEHWNGTAWTVATFAPGPQAPSVLSGVDDLSPTNAWAVGSSGATGSGRTLIEHWDGTGWTIVPSPDPETGPNAFDELMAVSGTNPDNLWAVGSFVDAQGSLAMLLLHWNGTTWTFFPPADKNGPGQLGVAVTVISPNDAWAVGDAIGGTASQHFNGTKWTAVNTPIVNVKGSVNDLTGITNAGPDDIWASGFESNGGAMTPYLLHSTGAAWTLVKVPNAGSEGTELNGVTALSAADIWVTGVTEETDGAALAASERFNGKTWSIVPALEPGQQAELSLNTFQHVTAAGPSTLLTVGAQDVPPDSGGFLVEEDTTAG